MSRWPILLLVVLTCALGLVACGDDTDDASVGTILDETFGKGKEVKSGRLDMSVKLDAQGLQGVSGPITAKLSGPFASEGAGKLPRFDFTAAINLAGQALKAGAISTGDKGFITFQDQAYAISDEQFKTFKDGYAEQAKCTDQQDGEASTFSALGISPKTWLVDAKKAGTQEVGGTKATHITASVDTAKFLDDVNTVLGKADPQAQQADPCAADAAQGQEETPAQLTDAQRKQLTEAVKSAKVDVWSGADDRTMRRMKVAIDFSVPEAARSQASGLTGGKLTFDLSIGALNEKQTIEAPEKAQPLDDFLAALQNGQAPPAAGGAGASGGSSSKYEQCMADAGQDVKKLQDCASLIGQ